MIRNRIWSDLSNTVFYLEYLSLLIESRKRNFLFLDSFLLLISILSMIGWFQFAKAKLVWSMLLSIVMIFKFLISNKLKEHYQTSQIKAMKTFYLDHFRDLETLWYKLEYSKISEEKAEKEFERIYNSEKIAIKLNKHDKVFGKEPFHEKAEILSTQILKKYI